MKLNLRALWLVIAAALFAAACSGAETATETASEAEGDTAVESTDNDSGELQTIAVTTDILADVTENLVGSEFEVVGIMPSGVDPHLFSPSAQDIANIENADLLITNGGDFEEGLVDVLEDAAQDVPTIELLDFVEAIEFDEDAEDSHSHSDDEEEEDSHDDEDEDSHDDEEGEDSHGDFDPHFFTDPASVAVASEAIVEFVSDNLDPENELDLATTAAPYIDELLALDAEVEETLSVVPADSRVLVTNHNVFAYFADRYDFEVLGVVIEGSSTADTASSGSLAELVEEIEAEGVPAIFGDAASSDDLLSTVAEEAGVEVGNLFTESLGGGDSNADSYIEAVRTNADLIAELLA